MLRRMADISTPSCTEDGNIASDPPSVSGTFYSCASEPVRRFSLDEQITTIDEEEQVLRERYRLREDDHNNDDFDIDELNEEILPLPDFATPGMENTFLDEPRAGGEGPYCAGIEFIHEATGRAQRIIQRVWKATWIQTPFSHLPDWLADNDFLRAGHRPQIQSFRECFRSMFRIHTETGNIWTHLLGCVAFLGVAIYVFASDGFPSDEKLVFSAFLIGAIICMTFSFMFHTVYCHSRTVGLLFLKLDYCGIAILIVGSIIPWLHFAFYCQPIAKWSYMGVISFLGISAVVVSLWDRFSQPRFRPMRAALFLALGSSGFVPAIHSIVGQGWVRSMQEASIHWLFAMGALYIVGSLIYACRLPERLFPGRFDIWFQSHQIFHVFVVVAAFVHYHGISLMASHRFSLGACRNLPPELEAVLTN
ncbi:hypothetical protein RvY_01704 [Ramazzottius varieornatus]|uniref:Uncharacterized protein n=1 Tax=Ramazzottius varieornatus TaxID=947166 RepID=A0A1D1URY0_RAMVA|nr:hypothetical protein RvY_01704 [Ramazzottius varieornatus]